MRKNLLEFLFGPAAVLESSRTLGEDVVKLFEEAADAETEQMVANKKPLAAALKDIGISNEVIEGPQWCEIHCDDENQYREHVRLLAEPDHMHALAEKGWVFALCGDQAMSNEPPGFKIGFIELNMLGTPENKQDAESLETVLKNAQKFATTPMDRDDDDLNPVETDDKGSKDGQKGVGKAKDGANPEGKPKGSGASPKSFKESYWDFQSEFGPDYEEARARRERGQNPPIQCSPGKPCPRCRETGRPGGGSCPHAIKESYSAKALTSQLLDEVTTCSGIPTATASMVPQMSGGINWAERRKRMQKRRGERTNEPGQPSR